MSPARQTLADPLPTIGAATEPLDLAGFDSDIGLAWLSPEACVVSANPAFRHALARGKTIEPDAVVGRRPTELALWLAPLEELLLSSSAGFCLELPDELSDGHPLLHFSAGQLVRERRLLTLNRPAADAVHRANTEADFDPLTGLGNRRLLERRLAELESAEDGGASGAVLLLDLDRFKQVNDTLGHGVGDELLKLVATRICRSSRAGDDVVRLGGDEFVVLQSGRIGAAGAEELSRRLVDVLSRPYLIDGQQINIGASVGVALLDPAVSSCADVLRHADLALYASKAAGRGVHTLFETRLETAALARREMELSLRRALGLRQFELHYQPQVTLPEGTVNGFEALIRWNLPGRGLVSPAEFIPLAEETGDIVAIGEWALRDACREAMSWPGDLSVAVNVSPVQFASPRFLDSVLHALEESGLPPARLEIEITEGVLIDDPAQTLELLGAVREFGVGVAMDDFGTGYSSLSYLNAFPFSKIKIDQSFVNGDQDDRSRALVQAILGLGASLGMSTLAEGVETSDQFEHLVTDGCLGAQGYHISRPIPSGDIADFLRKRTS